MKPKLIKIEVYKARDGFWRWRGRARNGRIVLPGESHSRKADAMRAMRLLNGAQLVVAEHRRGPTGATAKRWASEGRKEMARLARRRARERGV